MRPAIGSLPLLMFLLSGSALAQPTWFTIVGMPGDDANDYVQVDPSSVRAEGDRRLIDVRVSRAAPRTSTDGIVFRSFTGLAQVDCRQSTARYVSAVFHDAPHFLGTPIATRDYPPSEPRPMVFREIAGDYAARVIRAACVTYAGEKRPPPG
jgi:hypothetical protein